MGFLPSGAGIMHPVIYTMHKHAPESKKIINTVKMSFLVGFAKIFSLMDKIYALMIKYC